MRTHLAMVNWGVIFVKPLASLFFLLSQYTLSCSWTSLSLNQCHFIYHVFEYLGFIPNFTKLSVVELSVLRGVAGCLLSNVIKSGCMLIDVYPLLKVPHVSASAAEDTTFRIVLHSVFMGPFLSGLGFIGLGEGQSLI